MKNPHFDEHYVANVKKNLASDDFKTRRNCLEEVRKNIENEVSLPDPYVALKLFKSAVKAFNDNAGSCRERAVHVVMICLRSWSLPVEDTIFLLLPMIRDKLGNYETTETSEEIRLLLVRLLRSCIQKYGEKVSPFIIDIVSILSRCIRDRCPDVIKESCECLDESVKEIPEFRLHSDKVVEAVIFATKHKHYRVRVAAIRSFEKFILVGGAESVETVCGALGECLLDQNPHVRRAVYKIVSSWLVELRDRYSYFHCMLPLILTGLNDENDTYKREVQNWWQEIGLQYLKENEEQLKDKHELLPTKLENYPFEGERPNLGCRTLVSKEVCRIIPTLLKELEDWKPEVRIKSSELLEVIVLHAEGNIISLLEKILPIMCKVCSKREEIVYQQMIKSAEIIGYFVSPKIYWQLIVSGMKETCSLGHYVVFASLLKYSPRHEISQQLNEIIPVMLENNFCETRDLNSSQYLLKIISKMISCCEGFPLDDSTLKYLHLAIISAMAFGDEALQIEAINLVQELACAIPISVPDLHRRCLPSLFDRLLSTCEVWESYSLDFNILITFLSQFSDDVFDIVFDKLLEILNVILKLNSDREIIFKTLYTMSALLDEKENKFSKMECFERIILGPLKQQLIWKAGKVAEVIRATALSVVLLFLKRNGNISSEFLSEIVPLVLSLCEDSYEEARIYGLEILSCIGTYGGRNIDVDLFKHIITVVTGRLEDKRDSVRLKAIQSLKDVLLNAPRLDSLRGMPDFENIVKALQLVFIHVDDGNEKIQDALLELFKEPQIVNNVKSVFSEEILSSFVRKCRHWNVSTMLEKCLKIC